jgi:hypothetical protein
MSICLEEYVFMSSKISCRMLVRSKECIKQALIVDPPVWFHILTRMMVCLILTSCRDCTPSSQCSTLFCTKLYRTETASVLRKAAMT